MQPTTLPACLLHNAQLDPSAPALLVKRSGKYQPLSRADLVQRIKQTGGWLLDQGLQPGDRVAILSENRQEWIEADFACMACGGITVTLHATLTADQALEQLRDAEPRIAVVSTIEQRDKLLAVLDRLPTVQAVACFDEQAATGKVISWEQALASGSTRMAEVERRCAQVSADDLACISYTSGTTGESKGAMLTHSNLVNNVRSMLVEFPPVPDDLVLNYLPLSHIYGRTCDLYLCLMGGIPLALGESPDALAVNLQEVKPTSIAGVPRVHQKIEAATRPQVEAGDRDALRRFLGGRIRYVTSGGAALSPDVMRYYFDAGVPCYQGYGLTETSPVATFSAPGAVKIGAAGRPIPGVEIKITDEGEILCRGHNIMRGYWRKPEATAAAIDSEGWFHTGDAGYLCPEGYLHITERLKEIIVTAYGKNVAPQQIEGLLCLDPLIEQAFVYGDDKPFLTAVVVPAKAPLSDWAQEHGLGAEAYDELLAQSAVKDEFARRVENALTSVSHFEQVQKFVLRPDLFSQAAGELTLTAKLRRKQLLVRHKAELDALYETTPCST